MYFKVSVLYEGARSINILMYYVKADDAVSASHIVSKYTDEPLKVEEISGSKYRRDISDVRKYKPHHVESDVWKLRKR